MRRITAICILLFILSGCSVADGDMQQALEYRQELLRQSGCSFGCILTADYGDILYQFELHCQSDENGAVSFAVMQPASIAGIKGRISGAGGEIKFDETVLGFPILSEDLPTPLSGPWLFMTGLRGGYIRTCNINNEKMSLTIADSYEENAILMQVEFDAENKPTSCEFIWKGRRFLTLQITSFHYL